MKKAFLRWFFCFVTSCILGLSLATVPGIAAAKETGWECMANLLLAKERQLNTGRVSDSLFIADRSYEVYRDDFGLFFLLDINRLRPTDTWVDFGSGLGFGLIGYYLQDLNELEYFANTVGITYRRESYQFDQGYKEVMDKTEAIVGATGKLKFMEGKSIEDPELVIPEFKLGTDYFGPLSYTEDLSLTLSKYLGSMQDDGSLHVILAIGASEKRSQGITFIVDEEGKVFELIHWLQMLPGLKTQVYYSSDTYKSISIEKTPEFAGIPELELLFLRDDGPPTRVFGIKGKIVPPQETIFVFEEGGQIPFAPMLAK